MKRAILALGACLATAPAVAQQDAFGGDQILYELSYGADYELAFVGHLLSFGCTGNAAPFIIAQLPNPSWTVKGYLLGFHYGFINPNPYTGTRMPEANDPRRPSTHAHQAVEELLEAARASESLDFLCDIFLWDAFEQYGNAQLELVQYAIDRLRELGREDDAVALAEDAEPQFRRLQRLIDGDPSGSRGWSYHLQ